MNKNRNKQEAVEQKKDVYGEFFNEVDSDLLQEMVENDLIENGYVTIYCPSCGKQTNPFAKIYLLMRGLTEKPLVCENCEGEVPLMQYVKKVYNPRATEGQVHCFIMGCTNLSALSAILSMTSNAISRLVERR